MIGARAFDPSSALRAVAAAAIALALAPAALAQAPSAEDLEIRLFDELVLKDEPGKVWKGSFRRDEKGVFETTPAGMWIFDIKEGPHKGIVRKIKPAAVESYKLKQSEEEVWRKLTRPEILGRNRSDAPKYVRWADKCVEKGFQDLEEELRREAVKLDPKDVDVCLRLGALLRKRFKFNDELVLYDAAARAGLPRPERVLSPMGDLLALLGLKPFAEEKYKAALAEDPKFVPALYGLGKLLLSSRRFREADARLSAAADRAVSEIEKGEALRWSSEVKLKLGDLAGARKAAEDGVFAVPADKDLKLRLGAIYACSGEWPRAKEKLMEVLGLTAEDLASSPPSEPGAGAPPEEKKDGPAAPDKPPGEGEPGKEPLPEAARADPFGPAQERDPLRSRGLANLAMCLLKENSLVKAEEFLKLAAGLDPASPFPWVVLGSLRERQERWGDAKAAYEKALQIHPPDAYARYALGVLHLRAGDPSKARDEFLGAVDADPDFADALVQLGRLAVADRRGEDAALYFRRSLALCPNVADWQVALGTAYAVQGDKDRAGQAFREALNVDPAHPIARVAKHFAQFYAEGEGEAALKSMRDLRDKEKAALTPETSQYLDTLIRMVEENRGKVQWKDDFEKPDTVDIARNWEQRLGTGPLMRIFKGRVMIEGEQRKTGETVLERSAPADKFVKFEASVGARLMAQLSAGVQVLHRPSSGSRVGDVQAGLKLGKDASGNVVLWEWESGKWKEVAKHGAWPELKDQGNALGLELVRDPDSAGSTQETLRVRATLNGAQLGELYESERFRRRLRGGEVWAGVFAEAEKGTTIRVDTDDVRLVLLKK